MKGEAVPKLFGKSDLFSTSISILLHMDLEKAEWYILRTRMALS